MLSADKEQILVRIAFIDAPEKGQPFGERVKQAMSELVFGKDVKLLPHSIDRYGRLVAIVYVGNTDAGLELLNQGLCWVYEKYVGEASVEIQTSYRAAQTAAQSDKLGLWQDPDPRRRNPVPGDTALRRAGDRRPSGFRAERKQRKGRG